MNKAKYINFLFLLFLFSSCSLTKGLKDGQYLLFDVDIEGVEKSDKAELQNLIRQTPNTRIPLLNASLGVAIYRFGEWTFDSTKHIRRQERLLLERDTLLALQDTGTISRKQGRRLSKIVDNLSSIEKKLEFGNFFMRTGNPRVIYDSAKSEESARQLTFYLFNNGFFEAETDFEVKKSKQKSRVTYFVTENEPYRIDSFYTRSDDDKIYALLLKHEKGGLVQPGKRYEQGAITRERQRVEDLLKENGYYTFTRSYIEYNVYKDTVDKSVQIEQLIRKPVYADFHQVYTLDSVYFSVDPPSNEFIDQGIKTRFRDINYELYDDRYSEKIIASRIFLNKGDLYSRNDVIETQRQLANLDLFRFVNIAFDTIGNTLRPRIFTQPNQKYQVTNQLGASITEQVPGPFFSHSLRNRNLFRGAEIFEFFFRAGLEGVVSATGEGGVFRSRELNTSASVIFPQFLIPYTGKFLQTFGRYNPRTRTLIGYNYVDRPEYIRESVNGILSYNWNTRNLRQQYTFNALDANFIRSNLSNDFRELLEDLQNQGNNLINSFLPSYVSSISGQVIVNFNQYGAFQRNKASLLRLFLESGGTTLNLVKRDFVEDRNLAYFQFLKFQADFRRYIPISREHTFAYRLNLGMARPYGVSNGVLPYEKYFFAGGSTGIRAWQPRRLGPGSFTPDRLEDGSFDYRFEQPGEILFEGMFELRSKIYGYFDGAFFVDLGNSWTFAEDPTRPGANFEFNRFFNEIAVGTGLGLRMDFEFLVLRLDMGVKALDPARPQGERFILGNFFNRFLGERGQTVFNIGIGYPF
ncbi:outer membrane protein, OMP85 family, putative [Indibacter alkaliphilus LW1]|uniref:Outer membrane protein, OMP85 family, putative n=1 Tax=Indibacter alkaliphilus (strain CCUG 57479 / KCTC 22604 / LW1) TaxID=1189612 RepID=S2E8E9_INDAL|nr:BamA/TamA family outer membrane protein [Indibacter alkaliphilus]EOZ98548.1 outer membrane protein, OMP85 family, putative [Indibacter alkaliphilus LW1]